MSANSNRVIIIIINAIIKNNRPPAWCDDKSGDGKQVYYKSWPKGVFPYYLDM